MPSQVAWVTGASAGIGRHLAEGLAARGMTVVGWARTADRIERAMAEIAVSTGAPTRAVTADVTDRAQVEAAVAALQGEGLGEVDLLVNNAGAMDPAEVPVWAADPDEWWAVVTSHVRSAQLLAHAVVPGMVERGSGRVVDISTGLAVSGERLHSAYSVGKTGLLRFSETLAAGLEGTGVHVFDLAPGVVRTAMSTSMPMHADRTEWTDPADVVAFVAAIAAGELDAWAGRFLHVGRDDLAVLRDSRPAGDQRLLRVALP